MLTAKLNVGRLIEIRSRGQVTLADFGAFRTQFTDCIVRANQRVILACDVRGLAVLPDEVGAALVRLMKVDNVMVERSIYLTDQSPTAIQIDHLIREGKNPARRSCQSVPDFLAAVRDVLSPEELAQLQRFLG